jgi:hypothetical protein
MVIATRKNCDLCGTQYQDATRGQSKRYCGTTCNRRAAGLRAHHNLEPHAYRQMLEAQDHKCACCRTPIDTAGRDTHVDHNHTNGHIRGITCRGCNHALGATTEDHNRAYDVATYILRDTDLLGQLLAA